MFILHASLHRAADILGRLHDRCVDQLLHSDLRLNEIPPRLISLLMPLTFIHVGASCSFYLDRPAPLLHYLSLFVYHSEFEVLSQKCWWMRKIPCFKVAEACVPWGLSQKWNRFYTFFLHWVFSYKGRTCWRYFKSMATPGQCLKLYAKRTAAIAVLDLQWVV